MPDLKIQEATLLFKKIHLNPKNYDLKLVNGEILGSDQEISFKLYKDGEKGIFEVSIDGLTFTNTTGEWNNAIIMLGNTIKKIEKEKDNMKVDEAIEKLKRYISE